MSDQAAGPKRSVGEAPPPAPVTAGLRYAVNVWTVTVAGSERLDGEAPYTWVVNASDATVAAAIAERHHRISEQDLDTVVRSVEPGAPTAAYPYAYNDLRGIPSRAIVLTPDNIRSIARIRLALRRLRRHAAGVDPGRGHPGIEHDAGTADEMAGRIAALVGQLLDDLYDDV